MSGLTIEEFRKLSYEEKIERYPELSDHDRFLARVEDVGRLEPLTEEDRERFKQNPPKGWEFLEDFLKQHPLNGDKKD